MYEFIKYLLFTNLTLFVFSLALCNAQEAKNRLKLPRGPVVYSDYENAELIEIGVKLCRLDRHPEAVEASREALRRDLSDAQAASAKHVMARACDAIPSRGPQAKDAYLRIIREHPTYDKLPEIAYRLAELNVCIIKKGTEPDPSKGMEYLKLVIKREPLEIEGKPNLTYLSLKAHMMLGILQMFQGASEEAKKCFKAIYDCDVNQVVPLAHEKFKDDKEKENYLKWLRKRVTDMKKRVPGKLVLSCMSPDAGVSMQKLSQLQNEYPGDPLISEKAAEMLRKLNNVENIIDEEIRYPTAR